MAIDAVVVGIKYDGADTGTGKLLLEDRTKDGKVVGNKGQKSLAFDVAPLWINSLVDCEVWGSANCLMYKEQEIARREEYTGLKFTALTLHGYGPKAAKERGLS